MNTHKRRWNGCWPNMACHTTALVATNQRSLSLNPMRYQKVRTPSSRRGTDSAARLEEEGRLFVIGCSGQHTAAEGAPLLPTIAQTGANVDAVVEALAAVLP